MLVAGIDYNTRRIDAVLIPWDDEADGILPAGPIHLTAESTGYTPDELYLWASDAARYIRRTAPWPISSVAVEKPAGKVRPVMHELHGSIRTALAPYAPTVGLWPSEWRKNIGCTGKDVNTKAGGHARILTLYPSLTDWDEHALDALGIAHAYRLLQHNALNKQASA